MLWRWRGPGRGDCFAGRCLGAVAWGLRLGACGSGPELGGCACACALGVLAGWCCCLGALPVAVGLGWRSVVSLAGLISRLEA